MPARKLLLSLWIVCAVACGKSDPFDESFIKKDLQRRTAQEVHDAADSFTYTAPADGVLTEKQIADYVKVVKLTERIRAIAERQLNEQADRAARESSDSVRTGQSFAAIGLARNIATAELRACLNLGVNPKEYQWVGLRIDAAFTKMEEMAGYEKSIELRRAAIEDEVDATRVPDRIAAYDGAVAAKKRWEESQNRNALANVELVRKHRDELTATP